MTLIEIPQWGTLTLIEALWLFSGIVAGIFALLRLKPLINDWYQARQSGEDDLCVIAFGYLRREIIRVLQAGAIISIGVYAAMEPPAIPGPARISLVGIWITGTLISISFLVALQSYLDWRDRVEVRRILEVKE